MGRFALPHRGNHGLVAGCAFAKDDLKAFLAPVKAECPEGKPRDYVGDITLQVQGGTAQQCAERMHLQLEQLKGALRMANMLLNDSKQQVLGLTNDSNKLGCPTGWPQR